MGALLHDACVLLVLPRPMHARFTLVLPLALSATIAGCNDPEGLGDSAAPPGDTSGSSANPAEGTQPAVGGGTSTMSGSLDAPAPNVGPDGTTPQAEPGVPAPDDPEAQATGAASSAPTGQDAAGPEASPEGPLDEPGVPEPGVNPPIDACTSSGAPAAGAGPAVRVDFDMSGRPESEVSELGYEPWPVEAAASISRTFDDVTFTFSSTGAGTGLTSDWYKAIIQTPYFVRLAGDGLTVQEGQLGAEITMSISGLGTGSHTLLVFLNQTPNPETNTFAPIDIAVDGTVVLDGLEPSLRAESNATARTAYVEFEATEGEPVTITFTADTSAGASNNNVMINGFELNAPDAATQARDPNPVHGDEHVDADNGDVTLAWSPAPNAVAHDVYFGQDPAALASATPESCEFQGKQTDTTFPVGGLSSLRTYYWRVDEVDETGSITRGRVWMFRPRQLAFPDAEGYGRFARGGRGGRVVHVTNLDDSGRGSLRDAVESDLGPRTIVFDVGGSITLGSRLVLNQRHVTVAGQTAPGKGILIRGAPFGMSGAEDGVIRFVRVRLGAGPTFDGMGMAGSDHSIIDHASISWTIDEAFSSRSARNITLQRTLISECLNVAGHENYDPGTEHGYAASISGDVGSFHHNLLAHCAGRNWSLAGGLDGNGDFAGRLDIFNNVIYNWRNRSTDGGAHEVNFVANYYKPGAATTQLVALNAQYEDFPGTQRYYFSGNVMPGRFDEGSQTQGRTYEGQPQGYEPWVDSPFFPSYAAVQSATDAYKSVLSDVGCSQPLLDDHDARVVRETLTGTTTYSGSQTGYPGLPDHHDDVGGYEDFPTTNREAGWDSDGDGLPDFWELHHALDPDSAADDFSDGNADADGDGFTQLDDYLDFLAHPHRFVDEGSSVDFDLDSLFAGFEEARSYEASGATSGTVSVSGSVATFTPAQCGPASFDVTVEDAAGATMSRKLFVFVDGC